MTTNEEDAREALHRVAQAVRAADRVAWVTGAGLSVASGIAPYRKSKDAVWSRFIMEWGTIEKFHEDPLAWWREFWLKAHGESLEGKKPNPGHLAITEMLRRSPRDLLITQNIDGLHRMAGVPEAQLVEIHGRHDRFVCTRNGCVHVGSPLPAVDLAKIADGEIPECDVCGAPLRPLVLLFDEMYDSHPAYRMRDARGALNNADVVVFVGTSFSVGITEYALRAARYNRALLVNVNVEPEGESDFVDLLGPSEVTLPALAAALRGRA